MVKANPKVDLHAAKPISKAAISKSSRRVDKKKLERKIDHKPEHPLAIAYNNSIDQYTEHIKARVDSELSPILANFMARLHDDNEHSLDSARNTHAQNDAITQPFDDFELDWESDDKLRSGKTTVGNRIKKLEKVIETEEQSIAHDMEQLRQVNLELDQAMLEILGENAYGQVLDGALDWSHWEPQEETTNGSFGAGVALELEKAKWKEVIDATNKAAMDEMRASEKELNLRQDKIQQSFYHLLRDEDYY